jgi:hypothetical protein
MKYWKLLDHRNKTRTSFCRAKHRPSSSKYITCEAGCYSAVPIRNRCDRSVKSNHAAYQFAITVSIPSTSIGIIVYSNQRDSSMVELYDSEVCLSFKMPKKQPLRIAPWSTSAEIKSLILSTISRPNTSMLCIIITFHVADYQTVFHTLMAHLGAGLSRAYQAHAWSYSTISWSRLLWGTLEEEHK